MMFKTDWKFISRHCNSTNVSHSVDLCQKLMTGLGKCSAHTHTHTVYVTVNLYN